MIEWLALLKGIRGTWGYWDSLVIYVINAIPQYCGIIVDYFLFITAIPFDLLVIGPISPKEQPHQDEALEPEQFRKIFVGGLSSDTTDESLREFYSKWGELIDCIVMKDPTTKRTRGFGFVSYAKQSMVDEAMANRPHVIDGKTVDPKRAVPRDQSLRTEANFSSKRLYVSGIREEHTEEMLQEFFSQFGSVLKAEIINDKNTGKPRGFAFITFDDYDPVDKCVLIKSHQINNFRCDVKKALSKEEMAKV
ncbi:unnamed protein product [Anisakis simplex]|uniref:Heterogeneous nuclear ribonucleoprotein A1 (inferred by orthology to a C. elegans protein) n=1 Tax=Anisakis simplex TaxID=6269 RepID=A0A0M3K1M4_ANISI|nr:unnamed protein product [Anisakis simplex]